MSNDSYKLKFDTSEFSKGGKEAKSILRSIGSTAEVEGKRLDKVFSSASRVIAGLGAGIAIEEIARAVANFSMEFNKSMLEVATISKIVTDNMDEFKESVLDVTREVPVAANEAAKALYQIVSAGHDGADGMRVLEVASKAAIGGVTDTASAADAITTLLNAYKLSAEDAEIVSDRLFTTVRLGKTDMTQLASKIATVAPVAASFGIEMDQVLAAVASLTKSGTPTAEAMTQIRAAILASSKVLGDGYFATHTFQEGLAEIAARAGGSHAELRTLIPEIEALNGVLGLTGINATTAASDLSALGSSLGATEGAYQKMLEDNDAQITLLKNNTLAKFAEMGEGINGAMGTIARSLNEALDSGQIEEYARILAGLVAVVGTYKAAVVALNAVRSITSTINTKIARQMVIEQALNKAASREMLVQAARTKVLTIAKNNLITSIKNLGKAMLANPYALAAAAIAALSVVVYNFVTDTDNATKAMKEFAEESEKTRGEVESLLSTIQADNTTTYQKIKAYDELRSKSRSLTDAYTLEELQTLGTAEAAKLLNEAHDKAEYDTIVEQVNKAQQAVESYKNAMTSVYSAGSGAGASLGNTLMLQDAEKDLAAANKLLEEYNNRMAQAKAAQAESLRIKGIDENIVILTKEGATLKQREDAYNKLKALSPQLVELYGQEAISLMTLAQAQQAANKAEQISVLQRAKKQKETELSLMEDYNSMSYVSPLGNVAEGLKSDIADIDSQIKTLMDSPLEVKQPSGSGSSPMAGTLEWYEKDVKRLQDLQAKAGDNATYSKLQEQIESHNKAVKDITGESNKELAETQKKATEEANKAELAQQKSQIESKRKLLEFDRDQQLAEIKKQKDAFVAAGGSDTTAYDRQSTVVNEQFASDSAKLLIEESKNNKAILQEYASFAEKYLAAREKLVADIGLIDMAGGSDENVEARQQKYEEELKSLDEEFFANTEGFEQFASSLVGANIKQIKSLLKQAQAALSASNDPNATAALQRKIQELEQELQGIDITPGERTIKEWQDMEAQLNDVGSAFGSISEDVDGIVGDILGAAGTIITSTTSMINGIVQLTQGSISGIQAASKSASTAIKAVETASVILAVISAVITAVQALYNLMQGNKQKALEEEIEYYNELTDVYDGLIDKQKELLETSRGAKSLDAYTEALDLVDAKHRAAAESLRTWFSSGASWFSSSEGYKYNEDFGNILSQDQLFSMDGSQWEEWMKNNAELWAKLPQQVRDYANAVMEGSAETEELRQIMQEALTGISFSDLQKGFKDALMDMENSAEAFADNFSDMMLNSLAQELMDTKYNAMLSAWYASYRKAMEDGVLSEEEIAALKAEYEKMTAQAKADNEQLAENMEAITGKSAAERSAVASSGITASQESVDETNGRLTAMQGHTFRIAEGIDLLTTQSATILQTLAGIKGDTAHLARLSKIEAALTGVESTLTTINKKGVKITK